jgi:hypothetical protein
LARIKKLIPCANFKRTWNGIKSQATGAATYMYNQNPIGGGMIIPVDNGIVQWAEYHYECLPEEPRTQADRPKYFNQDLTTNVSQCRNNENPDWMACSFLASYYQIKIKDEEAAKSTWKFICEKAPPDFAINACTILANKYRLKNENKSWASFLEKSCEIYLKAPNREQLSPSGCAYHYTVIGETKLAAKYLDNMEKTCQESNKPGGCYDVSCLYSLQKNGQKSLEFLSEALSRGYKNWEHIEKDPDLNFIKSDVKFKALLEKYK